MPRRPRTPNWRDTAYLRTWGASKASLKQPPPASLGKIRTLTWLSVLRDLVATARNHPVDSRLQFCAEDALWAPGFMPRHGGRRSSTMPPERPLFDLFGMEGRSRGAGPARGPEIGRYLIIDQTEALTTVDEHRRLCRRAQFRRHHLQDQPGGSGRHRAPTAPCAILRHHHRRLHRHGARRTQQAVLGELRQQLARPRAKPPSAASRSWGWWR